MPIADWFSAALDLSWPAWLAATFLFVFGGWLCYWALFGDRARGRRRCPKCWYDLRGTLALRCSECGFEARRERQLHASHRRWLLAGLGLFVLASGTAVGSGPIVKKHGWHALLPDWGLLFLAPPAGGELEGSFLTGAFVPNPIVAEIERRDLAGSLSESQWRYLIEKKGVVRTRRSWPTSIPLSVCMRTPQWLGLARIQLQADFPKAACVSAGAVTWQSCGNAVWRRQAHEACQLVGTIAEATGQVQFLCTVTQRKGKTWEGMIRMPVRIVPTIDEAIEPVRGPDVDAAMRRNLNFRLAVQRSGPSRPNYVSVSANLDRSAHALLEPIAFGFQVEVRHDSEIRETVSLQPAPGDCLTGVDPQPHSLSLLRFVSVEDLSPPNEASRWSLRVRGDAELSLCDWDRPNYWAGEFTIPLTEVVQRN